MRSHDELALSAEPDAPAQARRYVRDALDGEDAELLDDARLVVTELVTNAQLHGAPPIAVRAGRVGDRVRVEVEDQGRQLLVLPARSSEAMTGRGLSLVSALSSGWGISPGGRAGSKVVWVELGGPVPPSAPEGGGGTTGELDLDALLAAWPQDEPVEPEYEVRLGAVPTDLLLEAKRHIDNVVRELTLARAGGSAEALAPGFSALVETVTASFAVARNAIKRQAVAAAARSDAETDLVLSLPASAAAAGERYLAALDEVDRYSRAARLLTLETPPVHRVFRSWYVSALVDQLRARARGEAVPVPATFVSVLSSEVTALAGLRDTADRLALLQKVNGELTGARTAEECAEVVVRNACESLGALSARTYLVDGDTLRSLHVHGGDPRWVARYEGFPVEADLPGSVVFRSGTPMLLRNLAHVSERFPALSDVFTSERSLHVAPLVVGDHRLGVFSMTLPAGSELDEDTQTRFVRALADALAQALERTEALESARRATDRLQFLAEASVALTASLQLPQTLAVLLRQLVPRLADWASVTLVEDGRARPAAVRHGDPARAAPARELAERYPPHRAALTGGPEVLRTGVSQLRPDVPDEVLAGGAVDADHELLLRTLGLRSTLAVPLRGRGGDLGVLTLVQGDSGRRYGADDVVYVEDVARRAALALETAQLLRDQSGRLADVTRVAQAAQQAILAAPPSRVGPVSLSARYTSAAAEALIGGDLYETVARDGAVRLIVGDVRGKGLAAVRTATIVLGEFRAGAADLDDLGDVARQVDRRVRAYLDEEDFVTALLAEVRDDGSFTLACCGHPPALLAHGGELSVLESLPALPLGLGADPQLLTGTLALGDRLLLYTDGVLDARDSTREFVDLMGLVQPLVGGELDDVLDGILARLHAVVGADLGDDLALLVAEYVGPR